jgi:signal transduction histidine kinase
MILAEGAGAPGIWKVNRQRKVRRTMEQTLEQVQKMEAVGQLTGGIAHDFNNILIVILGNLEMLESLVHGDEERALLRAAEAARLGAQLTERLLAFARRQPLDPRPVELVRQVAGMTVLLRRTLGGAIEVRAAAVVPGRKA